MQSREPVCHIPVRLHLIQDEGNLLGMKMGPWLAKLYMSHAQCNFQGRSTLVDGSGKKGYYSVQSTQASLPLCVLEAPAFQAGTDIKTQYYTHSQ